jgi:hypothetical protein
VTEAEWLESTEPQLMLDFIRGRASDRKLRLFAVACCRRLWNLYTDERAREAIGLAERYADGLATEGQLLDGDWAGLDEGFPVILPDSWFAARYSAGYAIRFVLKSTVAAYSTFYWAREGAFAQAWSQGESLAEAEETADGVVPAEWLEARESVHRSEQPLQSQFLRDLFGPLPFRTSPIDSSWRAWNAGTLPDLARAIYEDRAFDRLPLLADALEDAGCTDAAVLSHCRSPGPHVRGCWVVDLLLGKE